MDLRYEPNVEHASDELQIALRDTTREIRWADDKIPQMYVTVEYLSGTPPTWLSRFDQSGSLTFEI